MNLFVSRALSALALVLSIIYVGTATAAVQTRWTDQEDANAEFSNVLTVLNARTGEQYVAGDFKLLEATRLATSMFETYAQVVGGIPVRARNLRIWKDPTSGRTIQVEALLEEKVQAATWMAVHQQTGVRPNQLIARLSSQDTMEIIRSVVKAHRDDRLIQKVDWKDQWRDGQIFRFVEVKQNTVSQFFRYFIFFAF